MTPKDKLRRVPRKSTGPAARLPDDATEALGNFLATVDGPAGEDALAGSLPSLALALALCREALTTRQLARIAGPNGLAVVVGVPAADWVEPIRRAMCRLGTFGEVIARTGLQKSIDKPEIGNDLVSQALGLGWNAVGVTQDVTRYLPSALVETADIRVDITTPGPRVLRTAIGQIARGRVGPVPPDAARGLPFQTVAACIRRSDTGRAAVRRLVAASSLRRGADAGLDDVPPLEGMRGYGEAGAWGLALARGVEQWRRGERTWASLGPTRAVLAGPPGTGKTVFARSLAKSAGLPFHVSSVSAWFAQGAGYLGDVIKAIDLAFAEAAANGPGVLLLDELDALPSRSGADREYRAFWATVTTHLLQKLDGAAATPASRLVVVGATNHPERLDEALVRPGRLDRVYRVELPSADSIAVILRQHLNGDLPDLDLAGVAAAAEGATGATVAGWVRAARHAATSEGRVMVRADLLAQAVPPETREPEDVLAIARHEAAHAVAAETLIGSGAVRSVSVVGDGGTSGRTHTRLRRTHALTAEEVDAVVVGVLAGRAADEAWGAPNTGASGGPHTDLAVATSWVAGKVGSWGLGGSLVWRGERADVLALTRDDPEFRRLVEAELARLYARARAFVDRHRDLVDRLAHHLAEVRVLSGDTVRRVIADHGAPPTDSVATEETVRG